jgi:diguanylate cyclase (GGDEF)-like protein
MCKIIASLLFNISCLIFSFTAQAQYPTEQALLSAFELHEKTTKVNDSQRVKNLQPFLDEATKNHWHKAWVEIQLSKAILYSGLYQLKALMNVIHETLPVAKKLKLFDEVTVLESVWLEASGYSNSITADVVSEDLLIKLPKIKDNYRKYQAMLYISHYIFTQGDILTSLRLTLSLDDKTDFLKAQKAGKLAEIYYRVGDMKKYEEHSMRTIALFEKLNDLSGKAITMYNRIEILFLKNDFEEIRKYLPKFEQAVEVASDITLLGDVYRYKGMLALHQGDYALAKHSLNESKLIYQVHNLDYYVMLSDLVLLDVTLTNGDFSAAKDKLLTIKQDVISYAEPYDFQKYYKMATRVHLALNDYESAFTTAEQLKIYELTLAKEKNQTEIIKFEYEQSLKDQAAEKEHMQAQQAQKNIIWILIFIAVLLALCFLIFVLNKAMSAKRKLNILANTDMLTGAPNRRAVLNEATQQLKYCQKQHLPLIMVIADIDLFKSINDEFGHDVGDDVLRVFSDCVKQAIRQSEFYGRFGGEEWLFVLPRTKLLFAKTLFDRLNQSIKKREDEFPFNSERITFSMGAAELAEGDTVKTMIDKADKLLYQAKEKGRNCICY